MTNLWSVREDLMQWLKSKSELTSLVNSEIRELEWQGTKFVYPNIRVRVTSFEPVTSDCSRYMVEGFILVFDESPSSQKTDMIASKVLEVVHGKSTSYGGTHFTGFKAVQYGADRIEESNVWQGRITFTVTVS